MGNDSAGRHVVIYGGGMAGAVLARQLVAQIGVTLVDPNEYFEVPMAAPRNLVKPDFADLAIIPFARALPGVRHIRGTLTELDSQGGLVKTHDGRRIRLTGDVTVLATGSVFSNPLMRATDASVRERKALYARFNQRIVAAQRILIVGGGPIGVEVAGEITEIHPHKTVTVLEAGARLLAGTSTRAASHAASVLASRGVTIITGERFEGADSASADAFAGAGEVTTSKGRRIPYDLVIWCGGGRPNTGYMKAHFASALNSAGRIRVTSNLRVVGSDTVFALGDITDLDENKMAWHIAGQVKRAAANIRRVLAGRRDDCELEVYTPQTGKPTMAVTLGSRMGVLHLPGLGVVRSPWLNRQAKARHMLVPKYRKILGV